MKFNLSEADVQAVLSPAFFASPHPRDEVVAAARKGFHALNCAVVAILDQGISPYALKIDDLVECIGGMTPKEFCRSVNEAQKIAHDRYDGKYDPPEVLPVEQKLYSITAIVISEIGRRSQDINEYTVKYLFDTVFDLSAIETVADFACWCLMIEYFEYCLREDKAVPITKFIKMHGNSLTTESRVKTFIRKNEFFVSPTVFEEKFGVKISNPTLSEIAKLGFETFKIYKENIDERNF